MLQELTLLLAKCPADSDFSVYKSAILKDNVLLKRTDTTRRESVRRLRELYSLDKNLVLFRSLRNLWEFNQQAQPMLAFLCAIARDPMLRATASVICAASPGDTVTAEMISHTIGEQYPSRFNKTTLANIGRHAASSWAQSGHLQGRTNKIRRQAPSYPVSVTYALLLGYLCGQRGEALFNTGWAQLLDASPALLHEQAFQAARQGWLEYRHAGAVTEIGFSYLLCQEFGGQNP